MSQDRHFPDFIEAYLRYTEGHEGTKRFHLWSAISVIGAALERKVWLERGYYTLYPNLFVFLIGQSGLVKKSTTTAIAVNLLRKIPKFKMMAERLTPASLIKSLENSGKKFQYGEVELKQSALFAYASELSVFMQEVAGSISELLTTFYDCIPNDCNQPWTYETKKDGVQMVFGPCLNILGASTKSWLKKCIPSSEMEGGFASRIIFVVEDSKTDRKIVPWPNLDADLIATRTKLEEDLVKIHELIGEMKVTKAARDAFSDFYSFHMKNIVPKCIDPRMAGYMGRKGDLLLKIAMIRAVSVGSELVLDESHVIWAGKRLQDIEPEMRESFEGLGGSEEGELLFDVRNFIKEKGQSSKPDILRAFAKTASSKKIDAVLKDLLEMGEIKHVFDDSEDPKQNHPMVATYGIKKSAVSA